MPRRKGGGPYTGYSGTTPASQMRPPKRPDGELYKRPYPSPFSKNWLDGFRAGFDNENVKEEGDKEWRDGYWTGVSEREDLSGELDRTGSSNA